MRIRQIALVAEHLEPVKAALMDLFGLGRRAHRSKDPDIWSKEYSHDLGRHLPRGRISHPRKTTAGRLLERRGGDGGYMVIVQVEDLDPKRHVWLVPIYGLSTTSTPSGRRLCTCIQKMYRARSPRWT